jgi:catechol 2,3-dioxygenase-like lactoylglutathione lyase family enzyme
MKGMPAVTGARFGHVNLVARDWRRLADFYHQVFGCEPVPPERNYAGKTLEAGTGVPGARLRGTHLRLPGLGEHGPTLEIYQYDPASEDLPKPVHRPGFGHICFQVDGVVEARSAVLAAGGEAVGEVVTLSPAADLAVTWCYLRDPEGNVIELQQWISRADLPAP